MAPRARPSTGASVVSSKSALTFPAALYQPPQSQVTRAEDAVADRIAKLDTRAAQLGAAFGIPFTSFILNPVELPTGNSGWVMAIGILGKLANRDERISLERRGGQWGLYFTRDPAAIAQERRSDTVALRDAPLNIRETFLLKSESFFREYLDLCKDRLGTMQNSVVGADRTLELLDGLRLS
jgi:hypothetical protein